MHTKSPKPLWRREAVRDFFAALLLLGLAMMLALSSRGAIQRGNHRMGILLSSAALLLAIVAALTIVPRLARRVNLSRWMPQSFSVTREGGLYILAVFLLSLAAINTGNNLLFLILSMLLSAILTSGIVARNSLRSISISLQVPENVFEKEPVSIKVALRNQKRFLPAFSVVVEDLAAPKSNSRLGRLAFWKKPLRTADSETSPRILHHSAYFPVVSPGETRYELVSQVFPRRGKYQLEGFRLSTRFPFGFFRRGEQIGAQGHVFVYPSVHEVSSYFHLLPFLSGRLESPRFGHGESLYSIRKYQPGDSARRVDWKATAKLGDLMTRQYAREEESKFCLILDTLVQRPPRSGYAEEFEKAVSLAASLSAHFSDEGAELEFLTPREYVPRGLGITHLYSILRSLAVVQCEIAKPGISSDLKKELAGIVEPHQLEEILSEKIFKIIISSKPRGSFPATIWRSSHVVYFDEL